MITARNPTPNKYWLCPLYAFKCDSENVDLDEGIQIKRIPSKFKEYLNSSYGHLLRTIPSEAEWMASLPNTTNISIITRIDSIPRFFQEFERATNLLIDLVTAFRLYQKGRIVAGILTSSVFHDSEWSFEGTTLRPFVSSIDYFLEEPVYYFRNSDVSKVNDLFKNIRQYRTSAILDKINIALYRFHSAYHGPIEDRLIDQMIAFESLYLGSEQEVSYKLASRAAFLLRKRKDHRIIVFNDLKKAYNYRSRIVHGDNPPSRDEIRYISHKIEDYLRQSIIKFLSLLSKRYSLKNLKQGNKGKLAQLDENILTNGKLMI